MPGVDILTVLVVLSFLYLLLPTITWLTLLGHRSLSIDLWCLGGITGGLGILLAGSRDMAPDWIPSYLANGLIIASFLTRVNSLKIDLRMQYNSFLYIGATVGYMATHSVLLQGEMIYALGIFARISMLVVSAWFLILLTKVARNERSHNAAVIAFVYSLVVLCLIFFLVETLTRSAVFGTPLAGKTIALLLFATTIASVVGHLSYIGLILERSKRMKINLSIEMAKMEAMQSRAEDLMRIDRRRSLGAIASSLSHEMSQPLTAMDLIAQTAIKTLENSEKDMEKINVYLERIESNAKRASEMIDKIRSFFREDKKEAKDCTVQDALTDALHLLRHRLSRQNITLHCTMTKKILAVNAEPVELSQLILHVVQNAIESYDENSTERTIKINLAHENNEAILTIQDNGAGIPQEAFADFGKPFVSSKPNHIGLGISVVGQIIAKINGQFRISNNEGNGVHVEIRLPTV
jgi:C4-dicarboxylate-specific signal transduction histidine kinase